MTADEWMRKVDKFGRTRWNFAEGLVSTADWWKVTRDVKFYKYNGIGSWGEGEKIDENVKGSTVSENG